VKRENERVKRLPMDAGSDRRASTRFALTLAVRYAVTGHELAETGSGHTINLSSSGLSFIADRSLSVGQMLEVAIDWPALLDGGVQLQLIMSGVVVRTNGTETALEVRRHEFKTRRVGLKAVPPRESAG